MKKALYVLVICLIFFTSCGGIKTTTSGLENETYLEFVGTPSKYSGGVSVNIDDKTNFTAEVNKDRARQTKSKAYAISTGTHVITVTYNNVIVCKKQIFVSAQETKKIMLP